VSKAALDILRHSLGLKPDGSGQAYRNHFCIPVAAEDADARTVKELVGAGLMREGVLINGGQDRYYHVTDAGKEVALRKEEVAA
jgi:hypothetical protein